MQPIVKNDRRKKRMLVGVAIFVLLCIFWAAFSGFYKSNLKRGVSSKTDIVIIGNLSYLNRDMLYAIITPKVNNRFFFLNINKVKQDVLSQVPWARNVIIKRAWPRRLVIKIEEHIPKAIWNNKGIVNEQGVLIAPELTHFHKVLPLLIGPEDKLSLVWKQLIEYDAVLAPTGHKIMRLELTQRGSWRLRLDNGLQVILGTREKKQRLYRFVKAYNQNLKKDQGSIAYVDMRYTTGMAVGWKAS